MYAIALFALSLLISAPSFAAETYKLDLNHTNIYWQADHFGFSSPSGKFSKLEGTVVLDEEHPEKSKVDVNIDTSSIITGIEKFDAHLKSKDFFNAEQFPAAAFTSDKVEVTSKTTAKVSGQLRLLGITKPVVLDVILNKIGTSMAHPKKSAGFSASTVIKRSDWGMGFGVPGVSDEVKISIEAEANLAEETK